MCEPLCVHLSTGRSACVCAGGNVSAEWRGVCVSVCVCKSACMASHLCGVQGCPCAPTQPALAPGVAAVGPGSALPPPVHSGPPREPPPDDSCIRGWQWGQDPPGLQVQKAPVGHSSPPPSSSHPRTVMLLAL